MNTRPLHLLLPVLAIAVGYFAWDSGLLKDSEPVSANIPDNPNFAAPPVETQKTTAVFESSGNSRSTPRKPN